MKHFGTVSAMVCAHLMFGMGGGGSWCTAQEAPLSFSAHCLVTVTNSLPKAREKATVVIPVTDIRKAAPDFNTAYYRVKLPAGGFEPLDIPSQIRRFPAGAGEELVFTLDIGSGESRTLDLQYNPAGKNTTAYPPATQSCSKWYFMEENTAWENELIAYRAYSGVVDFFAKAYPHLFLHAVPTTSYHHEQFWGLDPYVIGTKPGLCGVMIVQGDNRIKCFSDSLLRFTHEAFPAGPVWTGTSFSVSRGNETLLTENYSLFAGHRENFVRTVLGSGAGRGNFLIAPGMQKCDNAPIVVDESAGYMYYLGSPLDEYGFIGTALVWSPDDAHSVFETDEGWHVMLVPDSDSTVEYSSFAVWYRASAPGEPSKTVLVRCIENVRDELVSPLRVRVTRP